MEIQINNQSFLRSIENSLSISPPNCASTSFTWIEFRLLSFFFDILSYASVFVRPWGSFTPLAFLPHWHVKWRAIMGPEAVVLWESILFAGCPLLTIHLPQPMRRFWCAPSQREATDSSPRNSHTIWGSNSRMWIHTVRSACSFFFQLLGVFNVQYVLQSRSDEREWFLFHLLCCCCLLLFNDVGLGRGVETTFAWTDAGTWSSRACGKEKNKQTTSQSEATVGRWFKSTLNKGPSFCSFRLRHCRLAESSFWCALINC